MIRSMSLLLGGAMLTLVACGDTVEQRAVSGGAIGAAGGAAASAAVGGSATTGALAGAAIGAATGALTDEDDIYLGKFPGE